MVDCKDFGDIAKAASRHAVVPFSINGVKNKALKTINVWIEDKGRTDEPTV